MFFRWVFFLARIPGLVTIDLTGRGSFYIIKGAGEVSCRSLDLSYHLSSAPGHLDHPDRTQYQQPH